jgi:adenylosuccinate lyase
MKLNELTAISPVDGRYRNQVTDLSTFFSEFGLIKYRLQIEVEYFIALCSIPLPQLKDFDHADFEKLRNIYRNFSEADGIKIKEVERVTNHDVKAVEYFIKEYFDQNGWEKFKEFIHFGLTSQDINNTAIPLSLKEGTQLIGQSLVELIKLLEEKAITWRNISMLARTHGQPASPTTLGKEIEVFTERLKVQYAQLQQIPFSAKFGGATGNLNAHYVAYPDVNWHHFSETFVEQQLGLHRSFPTTQIEHYDNFASFCDAWKRLDTILIDFSRDIWQYISINYFKQKIKANEVGSSAMPHKVNPIDFENAEGNLGIANALFEHLAAKLPISRLQRDLTDSTVLRNIGVPLSHVLVALKSIHKGVNKLELNEDVLRADLEDNWAVTAEAIQTILRREGYPNPYEALKALTRKNEKITQETMASFIDTLDLEEKVKEELKRISPYNYIGKYK